MARARALLADPLAQGHPDRRTDAATMRQLDGCSYRSAAGAGLNYLVWSVVAGSAQLVETALPSAGVGAQRFDPRIGRLSAGATLAAGPLTIAQVNVLQGRRLIQVTVAEADARQAKAAAVAAAQALAAAA